MMEDLLSKCKKELESHGLSVECDDGDLVIRVEIEMREITLKCCLGEEFPYVIPKVHLTKESRGIVGSIPHIYSDNEICIFDTNVVQPNFFEPERLVVDTIKNAVEVIRKGVRGENKPDFFDEFNEYWKTGSLQKVNSFVEDITKCQEIKFSITEKGTIFVAESDEKLKKIISNIRFGALDESLFSTGILIPFHKPITGDIPKTDYEIICLIKNNSNYFEIYQNYMKKHLLKKVLVLFVQVTDRGNILSAWLHGIPKIPNGFRKNHVPLHVAFPPKFKDGIALSVENCSQSRLFVRGGDGLLTGFNSVCIIGCGSVGSMLAETLMYSGTRKFLLVDNDLLKYENIARHSCGYWAQGFPKVNAVACQLAQHNPNIMYECFAERAYFFLNNNIDKLEDVDCIFVCVASLPMEHYIVELLNKGEIKKPIVIMWVEPYVMGAHALVLKQPQNLYEELFSKNTFNFEYSIVNSSPEHLHREAGCQSTYMPYSGLNLQMFVTSIVEYIAYDTLSKDGNYLLSWYGRLSAAEKYKLSLSEHSKGRTDFSIFERRID